MSVVTDRLRSRGIRFESIPHEKAVTCIGEARALGIEADEVLKTVVLDTSRGHALVVVPGARRLDMKRVEEAVGDKHAHLSTEEELKDQFPEIELGAMPPLGSIIGATTIADPKVLAHETVVFAAGTQTESVKLRAADLFLGESITFAPLTHEPEE